MKVYNYAAPMIFTIAMIVIIMAGFLAYSGEPIQKADDTFYDRGLANMMRLAGVPNKEIKYLLSLPTAPEVNLDDLMLQDTTRWFFVNPELTVGIVFELNGQCEIPGLKVYDLRRTDNH